MQKITKYQKKTKKNKKIFQNFFLQWKITKVEFSLLRFKDNNIALFLSYFLAKNSVLKKSYSRSKFKIFPPNISQTY
jgi:hypothetical protein